MNKRMLIDYSDGVITVKVKGIDDVTVKAIKDIVNTAFSEKSVGNKASPQTPSKPVPEYNDYDGKEIFIIPIGKKYIGKNVKDLMNDGATGLSYLFYLLNMTQMENKDLCWKSIITLTPEFTDKWEFFNINEPKNILQELCRLYDTIPKQRKISPAILNEFGYESLADLFAQGTQSDMVIILEALLNAIKITCEGLR